MAVFFSCTLISALVSVSHAGVLDLTGNWTLLNKPRAVKIPASVPGSMYTALYDNKLIPNPLYRDNDVNLRWIGRENWTYTRTVQLSADELAASSLRLVCDGLDTISTIYINDQKVGTSENMFVQYVYDIKKTAKEGDNTIRIDFESAVTYAAQKANASAYDIPYDCPGIARNGECHVNMIRKEQCSFSWDWGPSFPTQGIWKDIYIQAFNTAVIRELSVATTLDVGGQWVVDVGVYFDVSGGFVSGLLTTKVEGTEVVKSMALTLSPTNSSSVFSVSVPDVGLTFYFEINNLPVFFKGTNWIPADSFQENITKQRLRRLFQSAVEVHINSMRVWGGGVYESDDFYDLADEYGIMIWHDLMFSDDFYPTTPDFLDTVSQEITHQVRRVRHHPCIAVWSGNNEMEIGLRDEGFHDYKRYYDDYVKLYVTTIKTIITKEDKTRVCLPSSPSNGKDTEKEGWVAQNPQSEMYGDIHFYDYAADLWNYSPFRIPRFASEYGLQAWCDVETLEDVFDAGDFDYWGPMSNHRNHHPLGNIQMVEEFLQHFKALNNPDTKQEFSDIVYLTQVREAVSVQAESEHYRRWQNTLTSDGRGQTMGALYWQLNDIWQAPTWASIDYKGKWKMLHYFVRRFFGPVLISPSMDGNFLNIYLVVDDVKDPQTSMNDFAHVFSSPFSSDLSYHTKTAVPTAGTLFIQMYRWDSFIPLKTWNITYKTTQSSQSVFKQDIYPLITASGCPDRPYCFIYVYLNDPTSGIDAFLRLTYYNNVKGLAKAQVVVTDVKMMSNTEFEVTVASNRIAPFVWLDAVGISGRFSDNGFLMVTPSRTVTFTSWDPVDLDTVKQSLKTKSLMDVYA
ncbi:beta-mannosidase-like [Haliotis asinina]|uniref:beta-mannosidase-like n=1 Tax=Haliotis asinina TaxID=109174 RepID=UPI003531BB38